MNGTISAISAPREGTEFTVELTVPVVSEHTHSAVTDESAMTDFNGMNVPLCEDHSLNAEIAMHILERRGMHVTLAKNGCVGIKLFEQSAPYTFDAILMDIRMPEMDGLTAARRIRAMKREDAKAIPIIAMSANAFADDVKKSLDAGMNAHLAKPIDTGMLYNTLNAHIIKKN